jgi:putative glutamine amidotransferase
MYGIEEDRDDFEIELVRIAAQRRIPLLAICRGCQVVNVALGGTLIEDVHSMVDDSQHHFKQGEAVYSELHRVLIDPDSRLAGLLGTNEALVNSLHHQGIRKPAPGLTAIAFADDGVVEGLQHEDADWPMAAVQWHPEYMVRTGDEPARRLFAALIEWARDAMKAE